MKGDPLLTSNWRLDPSMKKLARKIAPRIKPKPWQYHIAEVSPEDHSHAGFKTRVGDTSLALAPVVPQQSTIKVALSKVAEIPKNPREISTRALIPRPKLVTFDHAPIPWSSKYVLC